MAHRKARDTRRPGRECAIGGNNFRFERKRDFGSRVAQQAQVRRQFPLALDKPAAVGADRSVRGDLGGIGLLAGCRAL